MLVNGGYVEEVCWIVWPMVFCCIFGCNEITLCCRVVITGTNAERYFVFFFFQAEDGIRDVAVTGVQTCALPICVNEVDHMAGTHTVDQITQRSAENERQAAAQQPLRAGLQSSQPGNDRPAHRKRQHDEHPPLPAGRLRQEAERRACVV